MAKGGASWSGLGKGLLFALIPVAVEIDALLTLALPAALLVVLLVYETLHFADLRERMRHQLADDQGSSA